MKKNKGVAKNKNKKKHICYIKIEELCNCKIVRTKYYRRAKTGEKIRTESVFIVCHRVRSEINVKKSNVDFHVVELYEILRGQHTRPRSFPLM